MLESKIQRKIVLKLESSGWLVIKLIQTNLNGINDLEALRNGQVVFIEVKQPGKKPGALQEYRHKQLREQGFEVIIATDVKDIQHLL